MLREKQYERKNWRSVIHMTWDPGSSEVIRIHMVPPRFLAIVDRFKDDPKAMRQAGIAYATEQIIDLIANGVNHVHIYTMNKPDIAAAIFENLSDIYVRE